MAKSQNDVVAAAQTLARLQKRREGIVAKLGKVDQDIETVKGILREAFEGQQQPRIPTIAGAQWGG